MTNNFDEVIIDKLDDFIPKSFKRIAGGRAWTLVRDHYAVVKRVSGHGLIDEIVRRRSIIDPIKPHDVPLRRVFADMARDLRAARRQP